MPDTSDRSDIQPARSEPPFTPHERSMLVRWVDPVIGPRLAAQRGLSGIEYLRAMLRGEIPPPPIAQLLGLEIVAVEDGKVVFAATPGEQHYNPLGVAHGALAFALMDTAIGGALQTKASPGRFYTTLELKINYVRPLMAGIGRVFGEATVLHVGRQAALAEARVVDANGKLYAHATSTCVLFQPRGDDVQ